MNVTDQSSENKEIGRILYVITKANWGGAQKNVYDLAVAAQERGWSVNVACGAEGELSQKLADAAIPVLFIDGLGRDISLSGDPRAFGSLRKLIKELQPDVVHTHSSKAGFLAVCAARSVQMFSRRRMRIIFSAHGWAFNESRPFLQRAVFGVFHCITVWCADTVICVSEAIRQQALWMPSAKNKCVVIHNGIEEIPMLEKHAARAQLAPHVSAEFLSATWLGTLAELHPTKGLDVAIRAFSRVVSAFPDSVLVLIGEGQDRERLTKLIKELQLESRVHFCGHVSQAPKYLSAYDIFLFPSRSEALGYAALEAGNAALPVIASRVGGIPEIIEDGVSGILVPVGDDAQFAQAITTLLTKPELGISLGKILHDRVLPQFSKDEMVALTFGLYKD